MAGHTERLVELHMVASPWSSFRVRDVWLGALHGKLHRTQAPCIYLYGHDHDLISRYFIT